MFETDIGLLHCIYAYCIIGTAKDSDERHLSGSIGGSHSHAFIPTSKLLTIIPRLGQLALNYARLHPPRQSYPLNHATIDNHSLNY